MWVCGLLCTAGFPGLSVPEPKRVLICLLRVAHNNILKIDVTATFYCIKHQTRFPFSLLFLSFFLKRGILSAILAYCFSSLFVSRFSSRALLAARLNCTFSYPSFLCPTLSPSRLPIQTTQISLHSITCPSLRNTNMDLDSDHSAFSVDDESDGFVPEPVCNYRYYTALLCVQCSSCDSPHLCTPLSSIALTNSLFTCARDHTPSIVPVNYFHYAPLCISNWNPNCYNIRPLKPISLLTSVE